VPSGKGKAALVLEWEKTRGKVPIAARK
jgi:hypothetical protein